MLFNVFQALVSSEAVYIGSLLFRGNIHPLINVSEKKLQLSILNLVLAHTEVSIQSC